VGLPAAAPGLLVAGLGKPICPGFQGTSQFQFQSQFHVQFQFRTTEIDAPDCVMIGSSTPESVPAVGPAEPVVAGGPVPWPPVATWMTVFVFEADAEAPAVLVWLMIALEPIRIGIAMLVGAI
jgi:hypothetical protein